jgi:mRNA interferase HigB
MRIIARSTLVRFWEEHPETKASLMHWLNVAKDAEWTNPVEARAAFSKAVALNGERVRYEVAGGDYRLIVAFDFGRSIAFIKFVGTHAQYDAIDALTVSMF